MIYSNSFTGGTVTLNGTAPTVAANLDGGSSSALWSFTADDTNEYFADGTSDGTAGAALLPFTPQPGFLYTMTASVNVGTNTGKAFLCMGFTEYGPVNQTTNLARFGNTGVSGYGWMEFNVGTSELFQGPGTSGENASNSNAIPTAGTYTVQVLLNTSNTQWTASASVNGVQIGTVVYSANPPIAFAGIGQYSLDTPDIQWYNWSLSVGLAPAVTNAPVNYWAAPAALGTGDGSSSNNAVSYLNPTFWSGLQSQLQSSNVIVNFVSGNYNAGTLSMTNMGNPLHSLTLAAVTPYGAVFSPSANILTLYGCQNYILNGLVFNGPTPYWGVYCLPNYLNPTRNICINNCRFLNLTNAEYAAIGLLNGDRSIQVLNCTFTNITNGAHEHMIYAPHDIEDVVVSNCVFQDCLADYVRFRDDSDYCVVEDSTFISTMSSSAWPFVSAELYNETNSDSAGDEFFGTYFQVSSNTFIYKATGGSGPYSGLHFSDTGYSPYTYYCDLTSAQASQLSSGSTSYQQSFLQTNMGIIGSDIKMFGNTYSGATYHMDYQYVWDNVAPYNNWQGTVGLNNVPDSSGAPLAPLPGFRNGNFDKQGMLLSPISPGDDDYECLFRDWFCSPKYTGILWSPGFEGTSNALRLAATTNQYVYQWITSPGPTWTMDCLFAIGSAITGTGTKFRVDLIHNDPTGARVSIGVNNLGQFGIYNGGTFTVLSQLGTVAFSVDAVGDGNYTEPGDTLYVYRLRIVGNYSASTPYVNIYTSDANSMALTHQALGNSSWVTSAPVSGLSSPETVVFYNYGAPVLLDQVAIAPGLAELPPVVTSVSSSHGQFVLSGTNGFAGDTFFLLAATNLASPGSWTIANSNTFGVNGVFSISNSVTPGSPQQFYRLQLQ
ncbi:MAG TPA: hypothetical protein VMF08_04120 [Candidatus Sulfotelmatobacter sp.]|nr:hypothetical protein [Candidatus Sulfotelmatobacter sp.]